MMYSREYLKLREQYSVIGGNDNLMRSLTEHRNIKELGEKALRRKLVMFGFKDKYMRERLPAFCVILPQIGLVTCYSL